MLGLGSAVVNLSALWKIIVASLVGGAGVAIVFGFVVLGVERARADGGVARALRWTSAGAGGAFCVFAVVIGIYAMTRK